VCVCVNMQYTRGWQLYVHRHFVVCWLSQSK